MGPVGAKNINILNNKFENEENEPETGKIVESLRRMTLRLKAEYLSEDGTAVDYVGLRISDLFKEFEQDVTKLNNVDLSKMSQNELKVFFINVYNMLTIHGLAKCNPLPASVTDIDKFWAQTAYNIGGLSYSLDDIEHGILRGNKRHPSGIPFSSQFGKSDPRLNFVLQDLDPRIHFALNCGAKSCPAISVYTESNLESALDNATRHYLENTVQFETDAIQLPKLLLWYGSDFGTNECEILNWMLPYLLEEKKQQLENYLNIGKPKLTYSEYDWKINTV